MNTLKQYVQLSLQDRKDALEAMNKEDLVFLSECLLQETEAFVKRLHLNRNQEQTKEQIDEVLGTHSRTRGRGPGKKGDNNSQT